MILYLVVLGIIISNDKHITQNIVVKKLKINAILELLCYLIKRSIRNVWMDVSMGRT